MDRLLVGIVIAVSALVLSGGLQGDVMAKDRAEPQPGPALSVATPTTAANSWRSGTVLSLLLTLEALRTAPLRADPRKVGSHGL